MYVINLLYLLELLTMLKTCDTFFQDYSMNKKLNKNSIYLKYNFCNNIHYKLEVSILLLLFFLNKFVFETVIANIDLVRKHLYFE